MVFGTGNKSSKGLRIIKTGRDKDSINKAVKNGLKSIIKKVDPSDEIRSCYSVVQNKKTGEIEIIRDHRLDIYSGTNKEFERVIEWTYFYPHYFEHPFAAYLIPKDIKIGERVFIEDLIEDYIGASWQGDTYRLESCEAIWNGSDLEIQYDPRNNHSTFVG
ncbi:hypothetical protein [Aquimarina sp. 2201CG14-23]|uniref:hypothetical protein n=1 Tax=Aquimarina mycalae TaxID=3040073 RepID=UPI002477F917|nr:hypothetical protein [Aquimarina sp. 2201CG14-23]MDH7445969.1 hypothetical protein [Aquimarina sp. 2201CG14-23]